MGQRSADSISFGQTPHPEVDATVDPESLQGRMRQVLPEHAHDEVAHANVRRLRGFSGEMFGRDLQVEPIESEFRHLRMDERDLCAVCGTLRQEAVQDELGGCEEHRVEGPEHDDVHLADLWLDPHGYASSAISPIPRTVAL